MIPENLPRLYEHEEVLRQRAVDLIEGNPHMQLHLKIIDSAMDTSDAFRQFVSVDEDLKVVQVLAMRTFNAFAASLKLALSGYFQNSALILRDVVETAFLLDFFNSDRTQIRNWRMSEERVRRKKFAPVEIRKSLDARDKLTNGKREELYRLFSELAGHATMKSDYMMRPEPDGDAVIGPYMEVRTLRATLDEMGKLAVQVGESICSFLPDDWEPSASIRKDFNLIKGEWVIKFFGASVLRRNGEASAKEAGLSPLRGDGQKNNAE
jgi:hypothetical protein